MTRLIDADELKKELEKIFFNDNDDMNRIEQIIDNAPTVNKCNNCDQYMKGHKDGYKQAIIDGKLDKGIEQKYMQDMTGELPYEE
jgi:hypothetical protein